MSSASASTRLNGEKVLRLDESFGAGEALGVEKFPATSLVLASATLHWPIHHFSKLLSRQLVSDVFSVAGFRFRLKFATKGAGSKSEAESFASFHLLNVESSDGQEGPLSTFSLGVVNQDFPEQCHWRPCQHSFTSKVPDWGFGRFIALEDLVDPRRGFVVNDKLILAVKF